MPNRAMKNTLKQMANRSLAVLVISAMILSGCDSASPSEHREEIVVESYLVGGEELPPVWLNRSIDVDAAFTPNASALNDATVSVTLLSASGEDESVIMYERTFEEPGKYVPTVVHTVRAGRSYRLDAEAGGGLDPVSAVTHVPDGFNLIDVSHQAIEYQDPEQWSLLVTQSVHPDRQAVFVFTIESQEPTVQNLVTPYFELYFEGEDGDNREGLEFDEGDLEELLRFSSPPVNEGNYDILPDGTLRVKLPWFAVPFYGDVFVTMSALDDNLYDFQRYQQAQQGGGLLSPGELPNVQDPIEGGKGIFGSMVRVSSIVNVVPESGQ